MFCEASMSVGFFLVISCTGIALLTHISCTGTCFS